MIPQGLQIAPQGDSTYKRMEKIKDNLETSRNALRNLEGKTLKQIGVKKTSIDKSGKSKTFLKAVIQG